LYLVSFQSLFWLESRLPLDPHSSPRKACSGSKFSACRGQNSKATPGGCALLSMRPVAAWSPDRFTPQLIESQHVPTKISHAHILMARACAIRFMRLA
jgi:hypothetical protein